MLWFNFDLPLFPIGIEERKQHLHEALSESRVGGGVETKNVKLPNYQIVFFFVFLDCDGG